ncbi:TetR/AcrR family transcriptional regulator [Dactylosporangium sp. CA-233914]|uniref:TetR/AcrR family transcriptional regulator n=1 Tax=Dactylosporangium sp. CA-233914 TaxID=3239934 RepID=UPI003D8B7D87
MRQNPGRRAALLDAAIEVLAREGSRGLTFRAVDTQAGVPAGTASNYFAGRDELIDQVGGRVYERLRPSDAQLAAARGERADLVALTRDVVARLLAFPSGYLALVELRLEAMRRPRLRSTLTGMIKADLDADVAFHRETAHPGDATTVRLLYLAVNWLVLERLTLPDVFTPAETEALIEAAVDRLAVVAPPGAANRRDDRDRRIVGR